MRHRLPVLRPDAIRWLGRALPVLGLLAMLALPLGGMADDAPFQPHAAGVGQPEKAVLTGDRQEGPATVRPNRAPAGGGPVPAAALLVALPDSPSRRLDPREPGRAVALRVDYLRPASQAPPVPI